MLIIFDLDDTLINTSGSFVPTQLRRALDALVASGVSFHDFDEAMACLLRLNKAALSSKIALEEFFEINGLNISLLSLAIATVYDQVPEPFVIEAQDFAIELLQILAETHKLALVTMGQEKFQLLKMEKAGIDTSVFSKICVTPFKNKKNIYKELVQELDFDPQQVIVCGDRIENDLTPAKELGFKTVHMRQGRGLCASGSESDADFSISHLSELLHILPKLSNITSIIGTT